MSIVASRVNPDAFLRAPELEVVARRALWEAWLSDHEVFIRGNFPLHRLSRPYCWDTDPHEDPSWRLYFHSLYFIGTIYYGTEFYDTGPGQRDAIAEDLLELLLGYFSFIDGAEARTLNAAIWDDHTTSYRASYVALAYSNIIPEWLSAPHRHVFEAFAREHAERLVGFIRSDKWQLSNHTLFHIEALCDLTVTFFRSTPDYERYVGILRQAFLDFFAAAVEPEEGTTREHALFYHAFLMSRLFTLVDLLRRNGILDFDFDPYLRRMNDFLWRVMPAPGLVPAIGDTKHRMILDRKFYSDFLTDPYLSGETRYIVSEGWEGIRPPYCSAYRGDGYYIARDFTDVRGGLMSIFLEKKSIGPHGHCDGSSFTTWLGGVPLFIDSGGPYKYGSEMRRDYFRTQIGHNVVTAGQVEEYASEVLAVEAGEDYAFFVARVRYPGGGEWIRLFGQAGSSLVTVVDLVSRISPQVPVTARFLFDPKARLEETGAGRFTLRIRDVEAALRFEGSATLGPDEAEPVPEDYAGRAFVTLKDTEATPAPLLVRRLRPNQPALMAAALEPGADASLSTRRNTVTLTLDIPGREKGLVATLSFAWLGRGFKALTVQETAKTAAPEAV